MRKVIYKKYGSEKNLKLVKAEKPSVKDDEIRIMVKAVAINSADWRYLVADPFMIRLSGAGLFRPKHETLGSDIAGLVEAVGKNVTGFEVGDRVMAALADAGFGGLSECISIKGNLAVKIGDQISYETAAAAPMPSMVALQALRDKGGMQPGMTVAVNGASGGVGTAALQLAKHMGGSVTAVCSKRNAEQAALSGADHIIDYKEVDFTEKEGQYDLILGVNGYQPIENYARALKDRGTYVMIGGKNKQLMEAMLKGPRLSKKGTRTLTNLISKNTNSDLLEVANLLEAGVLKPVVDRVFPVENVEEAFGYYGSGQAAGKVVVVF